MKRDRQAEGEHILRSAEATLRECLVEALPAVVESGAPFFTSSHFNSRGLPAHLISTEAETVADSALGCIEMREALGLPTEESVGHLFIRACAEADGLDPHRRGPRKLAEALLLRLGSDA